MGHLPQDILSALADDELSAAEAETARQHLSTCLACRAELSDYAQFDAALSAPPALTCDAARPLLSAQIDGESGAHESLAAAFHLSTCLACRDERQLWLATDGALRQLPAGLPSARVDLAIQALGQRERARRPAAGRRDWRRAVKAAPILAGGVAVAGLAAFIGVLGSQGGQLATNIIPTQPRVVVPGLSTIVATGPLVVHEVLNTKTNTLYSLRPASNQVAALDPYSKLQRALIAVPAKPITLAVNEDANRVYVLDVQRSLVEIDGATNTVVSTTENVVQGEPTAIQYDPGKKQIVVAASAPNPTAAPSAAPSAGLVVVLDSATKKTLESRTVDAAPQVLVLDDSGMRALLVSKDATTIVDAATYQLSLKLPGGVAGAFSTNKQGPIGIISSANGGTRLSFYGNGSPTPVDIEGAPVAITALPEGAFGVLINANGKGRIYVVDASGRLGDRVDIAATGPALSYDAKTRQFAVIGSDVTYAALPGASAAPTLTVASPQPSAAASPGASARPSESASPAPTSSPSAAPVVVVAPSPASVPLPVPAGATLAWTGTYRVDLPYGKHAQIAAIDPLKKRIWFVDQNRTLNAMRTSDYAIFPVAQLPGGANIDALVVGTTHVYAIDRAGVQLYDLSLPSELLTSQSLGMLRGGVGFSLTPDDRLWFGRPGSAQLFTYDPRSKRLSFVNTSASPITAMTTDGIGRLWFAGAGDKLGMYDARTGQLTEYTVPWRTTTVAMTADARGQVWLATDGGELLAVANGQLQLSAHTDRPITGFAIGPGGLAWSLGTADAGTTYGPVDGSRTREALPGGIRGLFFDAEGRAWLVDRTNGVFYATEGSQ